MKIKENLFVTKNAFCSQLGTDYIKAFLKFELEVEMTLLLL